MNFDHVFWTYREVAKGCRTKGIRGFEDDFEIGLGTPVLESFPLNVTVPMNPDFPTNTITPDNLDNIDRIVSERMSEFLISKNLPNVEFLPVTLINHKGRPVKPSYKLVHPIHAIDCLDDAACSVTFSDPDDNEYIEKMAAFALDVRKCSDFPPLFRVARIASHVLIHRELAKELDDARFSGNAWIEPSAIGDVRLFGALPIQRLDDNDWPCL